MNRIYCSREPLLVSFWDIVFVKDVKKMISFLFQLYIWVALPKAQVFFITGNNFNGLLYVILLMMTFTSQTRNQLNYVSFYTNVVYVSV